QIAQPQADAAPNIRAASGHSQATLPAERFPLRCCVRLFQVIADPLVVRLHAGVAVFLDRARAANDGFGTLAIGELENRFVLIEVRVRLRAPASTSATFAPASDRRLQAHPPDAPEPTTITSNIAF